MSYTDLEIWKLAKTLSVDIHRMSLALPKHEMYEMGSQIRRSSKSVRLNIVEGYGRRDSNKEYIRFLTIAIASNDETIEILNILYETGSLTDNDQYISIKKKLIQLGKQLNNFIKAIKLRQH
jgi:four helix bundle protein